MLSWVRGHKAPSAALIAVAALLLLGPVVAANPTVASTDTGPLETVVVRLASQSLSVRGLAGSVAASAGPELPGRRAVLKVRRSRLGSALAALRADRRVLYATQAHVWRTATLPNTPNDPSYTQGQQPNLTAVNASVAWATTHGNVDVAVLDTGIDTNHPDLAGKVLQPGETLCTNDGPACTAWKDDAFGHGTFVSGVIAAATNNQTGIAGAGWDTKVKMFKVLGNDGSGSSVDVATAIINASGEGFRVINLSLSGPSCQQDPANCGPDPDTQSAIATANSMGVVVVVAAGNGNPGDNGPTYPAAYPGVISVGAADNNAVVQPYSQYGPWVTLAAPGTALSTIPANATIGTGCASGVLPKADTYDSCAGTSIAAPHVAAAAGLLLSVNPAFTPAQVTTRLQQTATPLSSAGHQLGGGFLNMAAVSATGTGGGAIPAPTSGTWQLNGSASLSGSGVQLTQAVPNQAGSAFWPAALPANNLRVSFDSTADTGTGADGVALVLADPRRGAVPASVGAAGWGLGFGGVSGIAVALDEYKGAFNPSSSFVGVSDGPAGNGASLHWLATTNLAAPLQGTTTHVVVQVGSNAVTVWVNGVRAIATPVALPPTVLVGFSGGTGGLDNAHTVSRPSIVSGQIPSSPTTPIGQLYSQYGGPTGVLGPTQTAETVTPDNTGRYSMYQGGGIWQRSTTGVHEVQGTIWGRYLSANTILGVLGYPLTDEIGTPDGIGRFNHFQGGSIYWTPQTSAHEIHGAIRAEWSALGWERSVLAYPVTDETGTPDGIGRYNHFQGGSIYWTPQTNAHEIQGAIRAEWSALGWERSVLAYPVTDEIGTPDGIGRFNHFQGGSIYWSPQSGAHEVHGGIRGVWSSMGWETSRLGYPVSDEYSPAPGLRQSDFQHGSITWNLATGHWTVIYR